MIITHKQLKALGACADQRAMFVERFGKSVDVTMANVDACAQGFDVAWLAQNVLPAPLWAEYKRQCALLLAECKRQRAPLLAEYERQQEPLLAEYRRTLVPLLAEYERQHAPLLAEYERQHAPLWAEYDRQRAPLWAEYDRQQAPLWAEYKRQCALLLAEYERQCARVLLPLLEEHANDHHTRTVKGWLEHHRLRTHIPHHTRSGGSGGCS
jgi:hypothetical protein